MELQKSLLKLFNIFFPFADFVYLLQQEEYSLQRFWWWFPRFFFKRNIQNRDHLVYTQRAKNTAVLSVLLFIVAEAIGFYYLSFNVFLLIACFLLIPIFVILSNLIVSPIYSFVKARIVKRAEAYFEKVKCNTKVVAITGSYGKTTVKNYIEQLTRQYYKTQMVPGNINSTIGIANWILKNFQKDTEVLIVEMDSYTPKKIGTSTNLVKPDIAIITNIGDQHLQRYKTRNNLAKSLYELFENSSLNTIKITNEQALSYLKENGFNIQNITTIPNGTNNENLYYALEVANVLSVPTEYTNYLSKSLSNPSRRMARGNLFGFEGVDDSYNISFITALSAVQNSKIFANDAKKKLLVITAGIPELGPREKDRNSKFAEVLEKEAHKIFVLKSIFCKDMISGFSKKDTHLVFKNFTEAIEALKKLDTNEWFVLLQPELTDLYY